MSKFSQQGGFSILEQAAIYPILLLLVLGITDINSIIQTQSALQGAVRATLRCLYTVDGKCLSNTADTRTRLFNYYIVEREPEFLIDRFDFSGQASWIQGAYFRSDNFRARVLGQVHFSAPAGNFSLRKQFFHATRKVRYDMRTATFPFISGDPQNPRFRYRGASENLPANPSGEYQAKAVLDISGITGQLSATANQGSLVIGSVNLPVFTRNNPVFKSNTIEQSSGSQQSVNFNLPADEEFSSATVSRIPIVVHITGSKLGTTIFSNGGVEIDLYRGSQLVKKLGARAIGRQGPEDTASSANFVVRGVPAAWRGDLDGSYTEVANYPIHLAYDTNYSIRFTLHANQGQIIKWTGIQLKVFAPQEILDLEEQVECAGGLAPCDQESSCAASVPPAAQEALVPNSLLIDSHSPPLSFGPSLEVPGCRSASSTIEALLTQLQINECSANYTVSATSNGCSPQALVNQCPEIGQASNNSNYNFGVSELADSAGYITNSNQALLICPPNVNTSWGLGQASNLRWQEIEAAIPFNHIGIDSRGAVEWQKYNCLTAMPLPAGSLLANYPKKHNSNTVVGHFPIYTDQQDPEELLTNPNSIYACADFSLDRQLVDIPVQQGNTRNQDSLFYGEKVKPSCSWQAELKADAVSHHLMPPQAFFESHDPVLGVTKALSNLMPEACIDPNPEIIWSEPRNRILVPGGPFAEGKLPNVCQQVGVACAAEFVGYSAGNAGERKYNFATAAEHYGFNEIKAQLPRARWGCKDQDCVNIEVLEDGQFLKASASYQVPIKLFFGKEISLSFSESERKENYFANQ